MSVVVFRLESTERLGEGDRPIMSEPSVTPSPQMLERFRRRVTELTSRHHDSDNNCIGGEEIRVWNRTHREPCGRCAQSKVHRLCIVDEDNPNCRACRSMKVGCDRKPRFVFDMTTDMFFPTYTQFLPIYNRYRGRFKRHKTAENRAKVLAAANEPGWYEDAENHSKFLAIGNEQGGKFRVSYRLSKPLNASDRDGHARICIIETESIGSRDSPPSTGKEN
ncbi:hypothetical protein FB451DRAFT_302950 [Mycena latifolia]|nr:hypothetical protein FB451DRAFT_302950 [Mycena latifolia]